MLKQRTRVVSVVIGSIVIVTAITVCLLLLIGYIPNMNDAYSNRFADQLIYCPLPDGCLILEHHKLLGKLNGNGNGIDFAAVILLQADLETTKNHLLEYYSTFNFAPAKGNSHNVELMIEPVEQSDFKNAYIERRPLTFQSVMNHQESRYYAVIIYDGGYFAGFDLRGN